MTKNNSTYLQKLINREWPVHFIDGDIPVFAQKNQDEIEHDKYESLSENVDFYTGAIAFAPHFTNYSGAEGLYNSINVEVLKHFERTKKFNCIDLGCGVGRSIYDLATVYKQAHFVGFDYSTQMLLRAKEILKSNAPVKIDLSTRGFNTKAFAGTEFKNVSLVQGDVLDMPFKKNSFDCVLNTFLIDRVKSWRKAVFNSISLLKSNGLIVITSPLNWSDYSNKENTADKAEITAFIEQQGIRIINCFDDLQFQYLVDQRGNRKQWRTFFIAGVRPGS